MMMKMELKNSSELIDQQGNGNKQEQEEEEIIKKQGGGGGGKHELLHVLAVDDSLIDRKLLEKLLTVSSYQVTCVESGDKALEYLGLLHDNNNSNAEIISDSTTSSCASCTCTASSSSSSQSSKQELQGSKVNLIMTDYSMPGMSGYDLLKIVKGSSWKDVPVVVMSSENVPSRINMCLEGGAEEFLLKPVKLSDLRKLQSQLLINSEYPSDDEEKIKIPPNLVDEINKNNDNTITNNSNNNSVNKRKAMSPDISQLRPELVKDIVVS